jgi:hypothetical protein
MPAENLGPLWEGPPKVGGIRIAIPDPESMKQHMQMLSNQGADYTAEDIRYLTRDGSLPTFPEVVTIPFKDHTIDTFTITFVGLYFPSLGPSVDIYGEVTPAYASGNDTPVSFVEMASTIQKDMQRKNIWNIGPRFHDHLHSTYAKYGISASLLVSFGKALDMEIGGHGMGSFYSQLRCLQTLVPLVIDGVYKAAYLSPPDKLIVVQFPNTESPPS